MILLPAFSLLATLIYQYEFVGYSNHAIHFAPGEPLSGHLDVLEPTGSEQGQCAIYDFNFTTYPSPTIGVNRGADGEVNIFPLPLIPSRTLTLSDLNSFGGTLSWDQTHLFGDWSMVFRSEAQTNLNAAYAEFLYPLEYYFNETLAPGRWEFSGVKSVPEGGNTLALLALGVIVLIWRQCSGRDRIWGQKL